MIMTIKMATIDNLGLDNMPLSHPAVPWIIKHAAAQITRFQIRQCGRTRYEQIKGRACGEPMAEFGENVLFRPPKTKQEKNHKNNFVAPYVNGVWLGSCIRSGEPLVAVADGVYRAGQVRRVNEEERWSQSALNNIKGCPHKPVPGYGHVPPTFVRPELRGGDEIPPPARASFTEVEPKEQKTRPLYVRKEDIAAHGPTKGCRGCRTVIQNRPYSKPHTDECKATAG